MIIIIQGKGFLKKARQVVEPVAMFVMPPLADLTRPTIRPNLPSQHCHATDDGWLTHATIILPAGHGFSAHACMALTRQPSSMIVLRRETGGRLTRDMVLEGQFWSRSKWIGHWLIRLDALRAGVGRTTALVLDGDIDPEQAGYLRMLCDQGAHMHTAPTYDPEGEMR